MHKSLFYSPLCCRRQSKLLIHCALIGLITVFFNLLASTPVWAQICGGESSDTDVQSKPGAVDSTHEVISRRIQLSANWLDKFFDDDRFEAETNKTRLNVKLASFIEDGEGLENSIRFGFKLALPGLKKRFKKLFKKVSLVVMADADDDNDIDNTNQEDLQLDYEDADDENGNIGLQCVVKESKRTNFKIKTGVRMGSGTEFYIGPRYRYLIPFEKWALRLTERIRYFTDKGLESKSRIDFERPMTKRLFFRSSTEGSWYEEQTGFYYNLRFFLFHAISPRRVIEYEWRASYETKPHHQLQEVVLKMRYRQPFLKKWLFLELVPMATFPREKDFDFTPGFLVQLDFVFGNIRKIRNMKL
jgi:hypothetical protein